MSAKQASHAAKKSSSQRGFDEELAELEALSEAFATQDGPSDAQVEYLRKALGHRNNFIVSKAAKLVTGAEISALLPEVLAAYERFFVDAAKTDPKCWAKEALAKALVKLEYRSKDAYLRGMRHHQMEASWGPPEDTAGALRGTCTHALVNCPGISDADLLTVLLEPLTDADKTVRIEAARAIGNVGGMSAALILRLRALLGNDEPEVLGEVYAALLSLEGAAAIPVVARYLEDGDEVAAEAAYALAGLRTSEALATLLARLRAGADTWFSSVLLSAIALTRLPEAMDFLISLIERDSTEAAAAIEAIGRVAPSVETRSRVGQAVEQVDSPRLRKAFREHLSTLPE
ncbi:MAG: HEAT repeat domain-containing protein [Terracidiphilus sp.]